MSVGPTVSEVPMLSLWVLSLLSLQVGLPFNTVNIVLTLGAVLRFSLWVKSCYSCGSSPVVPVSEVLILSLWVTSFLTLLVDFSCYHCGCNPAVVILGGVLLESLVVESACYHCRWNPTVITTSEVLLESLSVGMILDNCGRNPPVMSGRNSPVITVGGILL